jgi:hypothetical protein
VERLVDLARPARFGVTPFDAAHPLLAALTEALGRALRDDLAGD